MIGQDGVGVEVGQKSLGWWSGGETSKSQGRTLAFRPRH
jgi:hypothetical protein